MRKNLGRIILTIIYLAFSATILGIGIPATVNNVRTAGMHNDYEYLNETKTYAEEVEVSDVLLVNQQVSCGYATIEMLSDYYGEKVTEEELNKKNNGKITTSSSNGFLKEINSNIKKNFTMKSYLENDDLLMEIHKSLKSGNPVAIEWAAKHEDEWTLHFSVVVGLNLKKNEVKVNNPYGYVETVTIEEFLERVSFKSYENMPVSLQLGFNYGTFHKNAIFICEEEIK